MKLCAGDLYVISVSFGSTSAYLADRRKTKFVWVLPCCYFCGFGALVINLYVADRVNAEVGLEIVVPLFCISGGNAATVLMDGSKNCLLTPEWMDILQWNERQFQSNEP